MIVLREMRRRAKVLVGPVVGLALTGYFAYNLIEGNRGLRAWTRITQELHQANDDLAAVQAQRAALDHQVSQMQPRHVDPDLLDTQVRKTLDLAAPNEIVLINPPAKH